MADDQFKAFLGAVAADSSLLEKLNSVADTDAVVAIAKEAGFVISAEALENHLKKKMGEIDQESLTDEQLEAVAGGIIGGTIIFNRACGTAVTYSFCDNGNRSIWI